MGHNKPQRTHSYIHIKPPKAVAFLFGDIIDLTKGGMGNRFRKILIADNSPRIFIAIALALFPFLFVPTPAYACTSPFSAMADGDCIALLTTTSTSPLSVPADWNNASNAVELIGAGGNGATAAAKSSSGGGGGGGAYVKNTNVSLTVGGTVTFQVGAGGGAGSTGSTTFNDSAILAAAGWNGLSTGAGGPGGAAASPQKSPAAMVAQVLRIRVTTAVARRRRSWWSARSRCTRRHARVNSVQLGNQCGGRRRWWWLEQRSGRVATASQSLSLLIKPH
jgi:hypothetical protein